MRILHVLSQRPSLTGSGVTLDALVRHTSRAGWKQRVVVGVPTEDPTPEVGGLDPQFISPLVFGAPPLGFPIPGMSDVMPYPSTRFSDLDDRQVTAYRSGWTNHLRPIIKEFRPQVIHSHHVWLLSSLLKDIAPETPVVTHCHATGLRQIELCPHLADEVRDGCARNEAFLVLHNGDAERLRECLNIGHERIHIVGAGYREDLFHAHGCRSTDSPSLVYIGKLSESKGLPGLLDAIPRLLDRRPNLRLHVAGSGAGPEADLLLNRMAAMAPTVVYHGQLAQSELAGLMRQSHVCVLPSFYEGLPLVLVEALACGCRLVATNLPGIQNELAPKLGNALQMIDLPRLIDIDHPHPDDIPAFVDRLTIALSNSLDAPALGDPLTTIPEVLTQFTWGAVFERIEQLWMKLRVARGSSR